jgi:MFS transporter, DHA1 family, tetracycline resistance protein
MKRPAPSLVLVFVTVLLDVLGFGLLIPVAPQFIAKIKGLDYTATSAFESQTSMTVGLLMATYAAMQFFFAPVLGSLSDRYGRRPVILISLLGSGIDYFIAAMSPTIWVLFITRAINGISGASITTCSAYIADVTPPEKRAAGFGLIGAAFGLGFMIGPLLGGVLGQIDIRLPYVAAGTLTLLNWLYGCFVLPESLPRELRRPFSWKKANAFTSLRWMASHRVVAPLAAALFILNVAQFGLHSTWNLSMSFRFKWDPLHIGASLFVVGITAAIVQGGLSRRIIPALGERACLVGGVVLGIFAFLGYGLAPQGWMIYAIIAVASIGGVAGPAGQAITSKAVPPYEQGRLQGGLTGLNSIAAVAGPLLATYVFRVFTSPNPPVELPHRGGGAPFLTGALLSVVSLIPVFLVWNRMPRTVEQAPNEAPDPVKPDAAGETAP